MGGGISQVNSDVMAAFDAGKSALAVGDCEGGAAQMAVIKTQMLIPLIQGTLRYAYKADPVNEDPEPAKEIGEGWAFAAAILPEVDQCDASIAVMLRGNMDVTAAVAVADGYAAVADGLLNVYSCLGITCADVGGLLTSDDDAGLGMYYPGLEPCPNSIAGYVPGTVVEEH